MIRFRLGGKSRECNLREFGRCVGIYTTAELASRHFVPFLRACIQGKPDRDANAVIWAAMSDDQFEAGSARESQLRNPLHRLMHRIISTSVIQKRGCEKVFGEDLTYMCAISDPTRFLHLPFALAVSLTTRAAGVGDSSPMAGGHFITRLARSYGLLTAETVATLTPTPPTGTSPRYLEIMGLILQHQAADDQAQPQLSDVMTAIRELTDRVTRVEDQQVWIGDVLLELACQQGRHPRPFPARAHDDEAGPSRARQDD
ncbi:hypothetical protein L2E82_45632 [Cichorium intybus]|uniref:Uncharacterized protein n=1 Tax=Cichorium intybus TaxID=13427 RepID=A0ACB8ZUI1_CICIN|nr:hypothetical protein L2E82_45632 [Cichorium intybus]